MNFGGWTNANNTCGTVCDGLPSPGDPAWEQRKDAHGCMYWYTPPGTPIRCGAFFPDASLYDDGSFYWDGGSPVDAGPASD